MPKHLLTKSFVEGLPPLTSGQQIYWDTKLSGFGIVIGKTKKSYVVQYEIKGRTKRFTFGTHGVFVPETARKRAQELLVEMTKGVDLLKEKRLSKIKGITLIEIYEKFKSERGKKLAKGTMVNYEDFMSNQFADWKKKELAEITPDMAITRHKKITSDSGSYAANHALKFLQTLYNYTDNETIQNPIRVLTKKKLWNERKRRDSIINTQQLPAWYDAVNKIENDSYKDCLIFLLYTGLRKNEAYSLEWNNINLKQKIFIVPHTKNGRPLKLPLCNKTYNILKARKEKAGDNKWVFPGEGKSGHITGSRTAMKKITDTSGVPFMMHDLRRTFITIAESVTPSQYSLKRLLNHSNGGDVTAGYIISDVERLRDVVDQVSHKIDELVIKNDSETKREQLTPSSY